MKIYSLSFLLLFQLPLATLNADNQDTKTSGSFLLKSVDGGQTWQGMKNGLPAIPEGAATDQGVYQPDAAANSGGFFFRIGKDLYLSQANSSAAAWKKESFPEQVSNIAPGKNGFYAFSFGGKILHKTNGAGVWSPVFTSYKGTVRNIFESTGSTVFIGADDGLYKSTDNGKAWRKVQRGGWVIKMVEADGVLLATSASGIIRSDDGGEHWANVISEGGVGIDVTRIKGGFAAITFNTGSRTRRVRASYDGGETWQAIDAGLQNNIAAEPNWRPINASFSVVRTSDSAWHAQETPLPAQAFISSIIQVGDNFFCAHPGGISKSSDKGKTWQLVQLSGKDKVFTLYNAGNVVYAVLGGRGC